MREILFCLRGTSHEASRKGHVCGSNPEPMADGNGSGINEDLPVPNCERRIINPSLMGSR